jgi:NAD(P)-dependent dehydrogenase (short-subunit alcohol dehydrogenase family)
MAGVFRDNVLAGKTAFVTGGGSGIGLALAECFAQHGAAVLILGRDAAKLHRAQDKLSQAGHRIGIAAADVRNYSSLEAAFQKASDDFGPLDIVVAAAAGNFPAPALGMSANAFKAVVDIDLLGTFNTMRAAFSHLRRPGASLLAISAAQAVVPMSLQSHVCAAKAGIEQLMRTLALEWGPDGVRCNCITPGPTLDTEGVRRLVPDEAAEKHIRSSIPLRRFGHKQELADLALFLCSEAASYITGATFACDGGSSLTASTLMNAFPATTKQTRS